MKSLIDFINEARQKFDIADYGDLKKKYYVVKDAYNRGKLHIVKNIELKCMIRGAVDSANGDKNSYFAEMYEHFEPSDIVYTTNDINDAVNWILKEKKIDPKEVLEFVSNTTEKNSTCDDPDDYVPTFEMMYKYNVYDSDRFYWAILKGYWKDKDVYPENKFKADLKKDVMDVKEGEQ